MTDIAIQEYFSPVTVDENPEAYRDDLGRRCRYLEHRSETYQTL